MGVVYRAVDPVLNRPVAIKVMSEGMAQDEALRQRFLREAQAAGSLQHPNVVTIYDFGETDGHLFIAMEFIEGTDLERLLLKGTEIPLPEKLEIMVDVLNGLSYAHRRGIVHRDIKPANIRIDQEGHARIMDFGVAHLSTSNLTSTGVMMGTPNYMAPEQITDGEISAATDLFSVGAVLYELLTNAKPFQADTLHRVLFRIVSDPAPSLLDVNAELPLALDKVVRKALAKDAKERYQSATEMANDLTAVRASLGAPRASRTVSQRSSIEKALLAQRPTVQMGEVNRWKLFAGIAAGLLLIGVGGGTAMLLSNRSEPSPASPDAAAAPPAVTTAGAPTTPAPDTARTTTPAPAGAGVVASTPQPSAPQPSAPPPPSAAAPRAGATRSPAEVESRSGSTRQVTAGAQTQPRDTERASRVAAPTGGAPASVQAPPPAPTPPAPDPGTASQPASQPVSVPTQPAASASTPPPVTVNHRPAIAAVIAQYAAAIGTRNLAEVRRVYAGMTPQQAAAWSSFFSSVRSMTANLEIASLEVDGSTAAARVTGAYEFVNRAGRAERQPAAFQATFQRDGDHWRLQAIR